MSNNLFEIKCLFKILFYLLKPNSCGNSVVGTDLETKNSLIVPSVVVVTQTHPPC